MGTVKDIQTAIAGLPHNEYLLLRQWFEEFDAQIWDEQIEEDIRAGKLDRFAEEAIEDFHKGGKTGRREEWKTRNYRFPGEAAEVREAMPRWRPRKS